MPTTVRMFIPMVFVAGLFAGAALAQDSPDAAGPTVEDQGVVDLFYRDKITAVRRTRDNEDDAALIAEMIERAMEIPDSPGVQQLIYETAIDLGMTSGAYPSAIAAAQQLRRDFPEVPSASDDVLIELHAQAYQDARRTERGALAGPYTQLLLEMAGRAEAAGNTDRAGELYREGLSITRSMRMPEEEVFEGHVARLAEVERIENRTRVLGQALDTNPRNVSAARELTLLLVLHHRDPAAAAQVVSMTQDPDLIDAVEMCALGPDAVDAPGALRVADWYAGLADREADHAAYLLGEAKVFYDRFLSQYEREDALREWVRERRDAADARYNAIQALAEAERRGEWQNLLGQVDPETHAIQEAPTLRGGQIVVSGRGDGGDRGFVVPFHPEGNYDLRVRVRFDRGGDGIIFYLPVGEDGGAVLQYSRWGHTKTLIMGHDEEVEDPRFMLEPGREVEVGVEVRLLERGRASIAVFIDGEACLAWRGDLDGLDEADGLEPSERHGNAIAVRCGGRYAFRSIEVREPPE